MRKSSASNPRSGLPHHLQKASPADDYFTDHIRGKLKDLNVTIEDGKDETTWRCG